VSIWTVLTAQAVKRVPRKPRLTRHSGCTLRRFPLTQAVLSIDLSRSAVPAALSLAVVRLNRPPSAPSPHT